MTIKIFYLNIFVRDGKILLKIGWEPLVLSINNENEFVYPSLDCNLSVKLTEGPTDIVIFLRYSDPPQLRYLERVKTEKALLRCLCLE